MDNSNKLLKKYFQTYLDANNLIHVNKEQAYEKFKETLTLLDNIKTSHTHILNKHNKLIEETETNCYDYINKTIESTIETEYIESNIISNNNLLKSLTQGDLSILKSAKYNQINFSEIIDNNTILHYAIKFGDTTFLKYCFKLGARIDITNNEGYNLLEFACLQEDPNMIETIILHGADMKKNLYFRDGNIKYFNKNDSIDVCILLKILLKFITSSNKNINSDIYNRLKKIRLKIKNNDSIGINNYTYDDLFLCLVFLLNTIPYDSANTYLDIIDEELEFDINNKLGCPKKILEIIVIHLVPFIDYPFNVSIDWVVSLELKYLLFKIIRKQKKNIIYKKTSEIKKEITNDIWFRYIKTQLLPEDYIGCLISQWISKIKV